MARDTSDARDLGQERGEKLGWSRGGDRITVDTKKLSAHATHLSDMADKVSALRGRAMTLDGPLLYAAEAKGAGTSLHVADVCLRAAEAGLRSSSKRTMGLGFAYLALEGEYSHGKVPRGLWLELLDRAHHEKFLLQQYKQGMLAWELVYGHGVAGKIESGYFLKTGFDVYTSAKEMVTGYSMSAVLASMSGDADKSVKLARLAKAFPGLSSNTYKRMYRMFIRKGLKTPADIAACVTTPGLRATVYQALITGQVTGRLGLSAQRMAGLLGQELSKIRLPAGSLPPFVRTQAGKWWLRAGGAAAAREFAARALLLVSLDLDLHSLLDGSSSTTMRFAGAAGLLSTGAGVYMTEVALTGAAGEAGAVAAGSAVVPVIGWGVAIVAGGVAIGLTIKDAHDQQVANQAAYDKAFRAAAQKAYVEHLALLEDKAFQAKISAQYQQALRAEMVSRINAYREYGTYAPRVTAIVRG